MSGWQLIGLGTMFVGCVLLLNPLMAAMGWLRERWRGWYEDD